MSQPLRIAQVAPPMERVPPKAYGGTERVIVELVRELDRRGHELTTFASGDSEVPGRLIATVPEALRPAGYSGDAAPYFYLTIRAVLDRAHEFDLIHSHLEWASFLLARVSPIPVVSTMHGRLDLPWAARDVRGPDARPGRHQREPGVVAPGVRLGRGRPQRADPRRLAVRAPAGRRAVLRRPGGAGEGDRRGDRDRAAERPTAQDRRQGPTRPAAERAYYDAVFLPALEAAGSSVEFLGELDQADRDQLFAESYASLMPGSWPEPFGLVAIEALACGTPVIARRVGGLPEIIRDGVDGFFGDDTTQLAFQVPRVEELDRQAIRDSVLDRFSAGRMTDGYEAIYRAALAGEGTSTETEAAATGRQLQALPAMGNGAGR